MLVAGDCWMEATKSGSMKTPGLESGQSLLETETGRICYLLENPVTNEMYGDLTTISLRSVISP